MNLANANEAQKNAIMHLRGPCLVLAGPGSGKTYTITNRILYLLEQGVLPERILVITFMKEAALSMQNRFREMAASASQNTARGPSFYPVNFGTFHSIFYHILRESKALKSNELLKNSEKKNLIIPILKTYESRQEDRGDRAYAPGDRTYAPGDRAYAPGEAKQEPNALNEDAARILSAIGYYKNTMQMTAAAAKAPTKWQQDFEAVCREYEQAVKRTGRLDFDDMLYNCKQLLQENDTVRAYWQNRFQYILIDEFQDINPVQYEAVKLLSASPYNIFAVGDDDQAIYGFRGSQPECLKRFQAEFGARQLLLDMNYRSKPEIVQASLAVIEENKDRFLKQLRAAAPPGNPDGTAPVDVHGFPDREGQYGHLLRGIADGLQTGESCAVLFRTNSYMQGFAARLKAAGIPYEMKEGAASIYDHFIAKDIMAYLWLAGEKGAREHMLQVMNKPSRYISREAVGPGQADFKKMREYYDKAQLPEQHRREAKDRLFCLERQLMSVRGRPLRLTVSYILKGIGYERYLKELSRREPEKWEEWQELLEWLKEDAASYKDVEEWAAFQAEYAKSLEQEKEAAGKNPKGPRKESRDGKRAVQLLTVHGAKGLEYDRVWIPDCNEKIFPHGTMPEESAVEEERRIFYVAMTRAKKNLELSYLTGTKERPRQPSRFLNPLYSPSVSSSNSQLSRYSSKASATASYSSSSSI
ncbi:ATP-dependent helicase [Acetatifactor aquisgranensis]|uniref:ATP-dependent helicase n=1 Tax=Acetatifactor aquisgranensis TaxID=2941233 RepID=UPI00203D0B68|nr:ATP-dependent helicase [Acetatifactor aquisgranensis]